MTKHDRVEGKPRLEAAPDMRYLDSGLLDRASRSMQPQRGLDDNRHPDRSDAMEKPNRSPNMSQIDHTGQCNRTAHLRLPRIRAIGGSGEAFKAAPRVGGYCHMRLGFERGEPAEVQ